MKKLTVFCGLYFLLSGQALAICQRQIAADTGTDANSANVPVGHLNILSEYLQPEGTPLGSYITYPGQNKLAGDEKTLYICDAADEGLLYEVIGLNEDRVGSYYNVGIPDFYYTWFQHVGVKLTHIKSGQVLTTTWQRVPLTDFERVGDKLHIKGKHFSPLQVDLIKVNSLPPLSGAGVSSWCGNNNSAGFGISQLLNNGKVPYNCAQPLAYSVFAGPGISNVLHNKPVTDYTGWPNDWYGVTLTNSAYLSGIPSCIVRDYTANVTFEPISVQELKSGVRRIQPFSITVECDKQMQSGVTLNQTAIGLQVSELAYQRAVEVGGLINRQGGVTYLLADDYGQDPVSALGVGIQIADANNPTKPLNFIGWTACMTDGRLCSPQGENGGWYSVQATGDQTSAGGHETTTMVTKQYIASLVPILGQRIKAGRIYARAYILVKVQ